MNMNEKNHMLLSSFNFLTIDITIIHHHHHHYHHHHQHIIITVFTITSMVSG